MRVAVVGGGVIGLCCAHYLEKGGAEVVLLERGRVGEGCSLGNGGWICPSISTPLPAPGLTLASLGGLMRSDSPLYIKLSALPGLARWLWAFRRHCNERSYASGLQALASLNARTTALYGELAADGVHFEHAEEGTLLAYSDEEKLGDAASELATLASFGVGPIDTLDRDDLRESEPDLCGDLIGGLVVRSDMHVRPESLCAGLAQSLRSRGVEVVENTEVTGFGVEAGRVVSASTSGGDVEAETLVLAAGAETSALSAMLGVPLPVQAGKGYSITVDDPQASLSRPVELADAHMGFTPFEGAIRTLGTMELSGINLRLDRRRIASLERAARRYLPGALEGARRVDWVGMRPVTPDGLPAIGPLPGSRQAYVATGHQMLGVTLAPATGRALAQLVLQGQSEPDLAPFDPARF